MRYRTGNGQLVEGDGQGGVRPVAMKECPRCNGAGIVAVDCNPPDAPDMEPCELCWGTGEADVADPDCPCDICQRVDDE
jgi:hypothetical protein